MAVPSGPVPTFRSLDEAARQTGLGRRTLQRWISDGKLKAYTIAGDRRRYVDLDEIKQLRAPAPVDVAALRKRRVGSEG